MTQNNYYRYDAETRLLEVVPHIIRTDTAFIINPSAEQCATLLSPPAYPLADDDIPPVPPEGKVAVPDGYELRDGKWHATYRYEDAPPEPEEVHTYKRSYIAQWIRMRELWPDFKELLSQNDDLQFMWETSTEFDSNHPMWSQALADVQHALGISDDDVAEMLHYGEMGFPVLEVPRG